MTINVWSVTALGIGAMIGADIFAQFGQPALVAGRETCVAFIPGGVVAALMVAGVANMCSTAPVAQAKPA